MRPTTAALAAVPNTALFIWKHCVWLVYLLYIHAIHIVLYKLIQLIWCFSPRRLVANSEKTLILSTVTVFKGETCALCF